ncbi:hypothetical protein HDV02_006174 [Globomyces sp. JEL0801]|nr:hypothetical protein HDV02_006174 [Globomyces sp. JEL0801]
MNCNQFQFSLPQSFDCTPNQQICLASKYFLGRMGDLQRGGINLNVYNARLGKLGVLPSSQWNRQNLYPSLEQRSPVGNPLMLPTENEYNSLQTRDKSIDSILENQTFGILKHDIIQAHQMKQGMMVPYYGGMSQCPLRGLNQSGLGMLCMDHVMGQDIGNRVGLDYPMINQNVPCSYGRYPVHCPLMSCIQL